MITEEQRDLEPEENWVRHSELLVLITDGSERMLEVVRPEWEWVPAGITARRSGVFHADGRAGRGASARMDEQE